MSKQRSSGPHRRILVRLCALALIAAMLLTSAYAGARWKAALPWKAWPRKIWRRRILPRKAPPRRRGQRPRPQATGSRAWQAPLRRQRQGQRPIQLRLKIRSQRACISICLITTAQEQIGFLTIIGETGLHLQGQGLLTLTMISAGIRTHRPTVAFIRASYRASLVRMATPS